MLIGLNVLKTVSKVDSLDAWFIQTEDHTESAELAKAAVESVKGIMESVQIKNSLRNIPTNASSSVPSMPRFAEAVAEVKPAKSPYQALSETLDADSRSSQWLQAAGLLQKFMSTDCFVDMTMTSEGGVSSVLRSQDGFRRTVMCRPDGSISQRITSPNGEEVVRFNNLGDAVLPGDKRPN